MAAQPRLQRTAASPRAKAGAICKESSGLAVAVVQPPPLPLSQSLAAIALMESFEDGKECVRC